MGTQKIVIAQSGLRREYEANVFVPDPVGRETSTSHAARVARYLNQVYGENGWREVSRTRASLSASQGLAEAEENQPRNGQLARLRRRAARSLQRLDRLNPK